MSECMLDFVLHREVEGLLGGGDQGAQQRRRLQEREWLPSPGWVRVDRHRVGILPEFCLAALVPSSRAVTSQQARLLHELVSRTTGLYTASSFGRLKEAVADALREVGASQQDLLERIYAADEPIRAWRYDVQAVLHELAPFGLQIASTRLEVVDVTEDAYLLRVPQSEETELHSVEEAPSALEPGTCVMRDHVQAASTSRDFLLELPSSAQLEEKRIATAADDSDALLEMFSALEAPPRPVIHLGPAREADVPEWPVYSSPVDVPLQLLEGANTMTRRPGARHDGLS